MALIDIFKRKKEVPVQKEERSYMGGLFYNATTSYGESLAMKLSAVYAATNTISNSIACLGINVVKVDGIEKKVVKHNLWDILNLRPDQNHNHFVFFKQITESVILRGNGYAYIERDEQLNVTRLIYLNPDYVTVMRQKDGSNKYIVAGMSGAVDEVNMLHFYMHCDENGNGISLLKYAYYTLQGANDAESQARNYFKNGGSLNGVLKASAVLTKEQKEQIRASWNDAFSNGNTTGVAVLPQGVDYQPISMDSKDQQLLESRQFGIIEIARFFCIPPAKLMVWENVSYNALEYAQLIYLTDTLQPYVEMLTNEMNVKLFKPSQVGKLAVSFDYTNLLVTDKSSEVKYYGDMVKNGLMSPNEARMKLGMERIPEELGGDAYYMQMSYSTLENIKNGVLIKGQQQSQGQQVDNQVKIEE